MSVSPIHHAEFPALADGYMRPEEQPTVLVHGSARVDGVKGSVDWTAEFPDELAYEGLTGLMPGFGGIKRSSRAERHANAVEGRPTFSFEPPRTTVSKTEDLFDSQAVHVRSFDSVYKGVQQAIATDRSIPNRKRIESNRLVTSPHSMSGHSGTEWAIDNHTKVEAVIYKAAAGFGAVSVRELAPIEFAKELTDYFTSGEIDLNARNLYRIMRYYGRNLSRTVGEAGHCLTHDVRERVDYLGSLGVRTGYLAFEDDAVVSAKQAGLNVPGHVDSFVVMPGYGHLAPQRHARDVAAATFAMQKQITETQPFLRLV